MFTIAGRDVPEEEYRTKREETIKHLVNSKIEILKMKTNVSKIMHDVQLFEESIELSTAFENLYKVLELVAEKTKVKLNQDKF